MEWRDTIASPKDPQEYYVQDKRLSTYGCRKPLVTDVGGTLPRDNSLHFQGSVFLADFDSIKNTCHVSAAFT